MSFCSVSSFNSLVNKNQKQKPVVINFIKSSSLITLHNNGPFYFYSSVSANGQYSVISVYNTNYVYVSSNYGITFTSVTLSSSSTWNYTYTSSSGKYMAVINFAGIIMFSSNYGVSFSSISQNVSTNGNYFNYVISSNENIFLALNTPNNNLVKSTNGTTYTSASSDLSGISLAHLSISTDGSIQAVVSSSTIYVSINSGTSWTSYTGYTNLQQIRMSSNGNYIYAADNSGSFIRGIGNGSTYNWTQINVSNNNGFYTDLTGQYVMAVALKNVYFSSNYGASFTNTSYTNAVNIGAASMTGDGKISLISSQDGKVYLSNNYCTTFSIATTGLSTDTSNDYVYISTSNTGKVAILTQNYINSNVSVSSS